MYVEFYITNTFLCNGKTIKNDVTEIESRVKKRNYFMIKHVVKIKYIYFEL